MIIDAGFKYFSLHAVSPLKRLIGRMLQVAGILTLLLFSTVSIQAQTLQFDRISVEDGLSQSAVNDILQDRYGFLWIATQDGLNRWDGYRFLQFRSDPSDSLSLPADWISSLAEDSDGRIWIGTHGGGVSRLDPESGVFRSWKNEAGKPRSLPDDVATDVLVSPTGEVWISTYGGVSLYEESTDDFRNFLPGDGSIESPRVMVLSEGPDGTLWAGTDRGGLSRFDAGTETFPRVDLQLRGPGSDIILSLLDEGSLLWIGTAGQGLMRLDTSAGIVTSFRSEPIDAARSSERILSIMRTRAGVLYAGTDGAGLGRVDESSHILHLQSAQPVRPYALRNGTIPVLFEDGVGDLWVGTTGSGLHRRRSIEHYAATSEKAESISDNHVLALYEAESGVIWVGSNGGGLDLMDPGSGRVRHYVNRAGRSNTLSHDRVMDISPADGEDLWVSTGGGLNRLDTRSGRFTRFMAGGRSGALSDNRVFVARQSARFPDRLYVGTWSGFNVMDIASGKFRIYRTDPERPKSISSNRVISIAEAPGGIVWIGTMGGGLNRFDPEAETFDHFDLASGTLSNDIVADVLIDSENRIWVATAAGLNRGETVDGSFEAVDLSGALPDETIYALEEGPGGLIWMSTNNGLAALDPVTGEVRTLDVTDGLQSNEFNQGASFRAPSGALLFGGVNGFNRFNVTDVFPAEPAAVRMTLVQTSKTVWPATALPLLKTIELDPDERDLSLEFAGLDFRNASRVEYEILLSGVDRDWHTLPSERRFTTYSRLPSGEHTLSIRARNRGSKWSVLSPSVLIRVTPPFRESLWFRSLLVLGLVGLSLAVMSYFHRRQISALEQRRADEREIHRRLMESREAERIRLAQDLHDGAIQDLYGVRFKMESDQTSESVQNVISGLREICGELRPPVLEAFGLMRAIRTHAEGLRDRSDSPEIHLALEVVDDDLSDSVRLGLFRVYQEALQNVFKHAEASRVKVSLRSIDGQIVLSIRDDGKGFIVPESWLSLGRKNHFGLMGLSERVAAMDGVMSVLSDPGSGTEVTVRLQPRQRAQID
jgi:signal transduction histidine kinase/ligand-binding sensor domain-containing protein